jgi:hypothetical protein
MPSSEFVETAIATTIVPGTTPKRSRWWRALYCTAVKNWILNFDDADAVFLVLLLQASKLLLYHRHHTKTLNSSTHPYIHRR